MKKQKNLVKLANCILSALLELKKARLKDIQSRLEDIGYRSSEAIKDSHRFFTSIEKSWFCAAQQTIDKISRDMNDFSYHLGRFKELINRDEVCIPTLSDIVSELLAMEQEFEKFSFNLAEKTISVMTKSIVLENVSFGPFEIKLLLNDFNKLYQDRPYSVIALDPNPAATDEDVTHPHVSHEKLCEGDGHTAISKALEQGRLCDFFTMVIGVLENYNPSSPYVSIDDWEGRGCYDCGRSMSSEDSYYCEYCDNDFCDHCSTYCQKCDTTVCLGCAYECPNCGQPVCNRCTAKCKDCEEVFCKDCLADGLCQSCEEQRKEDEYGEEQESEPIPSVQSDSVG
ncbi:MAG TPA: hypothetical protein PKB02_01650 [Anaerohalosphaeraceae bacterium]|nr:hypothetical protein [Anaerohalosphaeraceae bacterium]